jgi:DEAD/DEAH box helicase domain-containing protein
VSDVVRTRVPEVDALRGRDLLDRVLAGSRHDPVTHVEQVPPRPGRPAEWPDWAPELLVDRFRARGITRPWKHQVAAASLAHAGRSVVIATGTASGKSLAYQLPVLSALLADRKATALYLSPTKALAADQLRSLRSLVLPDVRAAAFDGDTAPPERDWVRAHSRLVLTNPDMLHRGILPSHTRWATFLRRLQYVVVDECHTYRGVFGSHAGCSCASQLLASSVILLSTQFCISGIS